MESCSISSLIPNPLKLRDEDPLLDANKLSFANLVQVFNSPSAVNPI
jgi:hypothetical protein